MSNLRGLEATLPLCAPNSRVNSCNRRISENLFCRVVPRASGSYAWPGLTIASDGEFVQLRPESESAPDVSAVRYLRNVTVDVPVTRFEQAVENFLDAVDARLVVRVPEEREMSERRDELRIELGEAQVPPYPVIRVDALGKAVKPPAEQGGRSCGNGYGEPVPCPLPWHHSRLRMSNYPTAQVHALASSSSKLLAALLGRGFGLLAVRASYSAVVAISVRSSLTSLSLPPTRRLFAMRSRSGLGTTANVLPSPPSIHYFVLTSGRGNSCLAVTGVLSARGHAIAIEYHATSHTGSFLGEL